jgi:hypothetical protein
LAALTAADLAKVSAAIKAARKATDSQFIDIETVLRSAGASLIATDRSAAQTFFALSELLAVAREGYEKRRAET